MENFSFTTLKNLNFEQQKQYILKYFIPLSNGHHAMLTNNEYELLPDDVINKVYLNRCDDNLICVLNYQRLNHTNHFQKKLKPKSIYF